MAGSLPGIAPRPASHKTTLSARWLPGHCQCGQWGRVQSQGAVAKAPPLPCFQRALKNHPDLPLLQPHHRAALPSVPQHTCTQLPLQSPLVGSTAEAPLPKAGVSLRANPCPRSHHTPWGLSRDLVSPSRPPSSCSIHSFIPQCLLRSPDPLPF